MPKTTKHLSTEEKARRYDAIMEYRRSLYQKHKERINAKARDRWHAMREAIKREEGTK